MKTLALEKTTRSHIAISKNTAQNLVAQGRISIDVLKFYLEDKLDDDPE